MAIIGSFNLKDSKWTGTIRTLTVNVKTQFVPNDQLLDGAPAYRVFAGGAELGAAWTQTAQESGKDYLSVKLDDPSFPKPIRAAFFIDEDAGTAILVWNRPKL